MFYNPISVFAERRFVRMKLIAYYLPQFHENPDNNEFWGKGFTEWKNVKAAKPLFSGHCQPRVPYQNNYYDLSDPEIMVHQMKLAKEYGLYGFCFYHYWFNGRKVLEKPVENILKTPAADLPFCLAWANEPWATTWHTGGGQYKVLVEQEYGEEKEWIEHFNYLLQFFNDERYIKISGKPVLLIYNLDEIDCRKKMLACWCNAAKKVGFNGLYIISMQNTKKRNPKSAFVSATVDFQPKMLTLDIKWFQKKIMDWKGKNGYKFSKVPFIKNHLYTKFDYDELNRSYLNTKKGKNHFRGAFLWYDDTPRRREWSVLIDNFTPKKFEYYLKENIKKSMEEGNDMLFINAWNEWGEGAYLEPDEKYGYEYLQAVQNALKSFSYEEAKE